MKEHINETTYFYECHGSGPTLVMLHGFTGSTKTWDSFIATYEKKFRLITVDLPGHGQTTQDTPITMAECCQDLDHLFRKLELEQFYLLGYSMGGRTALAYALQYPEQIAGLILESASPGLRTTVERMARKKHDEQLAMTLETKGLTHFINYWENIPLFSTQKQLNTAVRNKIRWEREAQRNTGLAASLRGMGTGSQPSFWKQLPMLGMPVLLLAGSLDVKFVKIQQDMAQALPNAVKNIIFDAGHAIHVEQPEIFGKIVTEFILSVQK